VTSLGVDRDVVIVACAISAGIHAALTPEHFDEGVGAGGGFLVAAVVLGVLAVVLTRRRAPAVALLASALVFAGLIASYVLAITNGVPLLHPEVEPVETLAVVTKAIEAVGIVAAVRALRLPIPTPAPIPPALTALIGIFSALVTLAVAGGHGGSA